jgi:hypothetical protein
MNLSKSSNSSLVFQVGLPLTSVGRNRDAIPPHKLAHSLKMSLHRFGSPLAARTSVSALACQAVCKMIDLQNDARLIQRAFLATAPPFPPPFVPMAILFG